MMKIITVGKLTQKYLQTGIDYYQKQIFHPILWVEVKDEKNEEGLEKEASRIHPLIKDQDFVIVLAIEGKTMSSEAFAKVLDDARSHYQGDIVFILGGSYGLSDSIKKRAQLTLSFSKMTFPHQLMRLVLMEQIYRGYAILKNHPYHK